MIRRPGDELAELLWDNNGPALHRATPPTQQFPSPAAPFQPFTCSAAGSSRAHELNKHMDDDVFHHHHHDDDDEDAVPWLHCPVIDDGVDSDTAPLPPEYCAGLLSSGGYSSALHHAVPDPTPTPSIAPPSSNVPRAMPPTSAAAAGESVMNFSFFSRPLQRPHASVAAAAASTVVQQTAASRLRDTPLFSEQRMAWLQQPPPNKAPPRATHPSAPPQTAPPPPATDHNHHRHVELEAAATATHQHRMQLQHPPDARRVPPPADAAVTTSSVCSGNGDRSQQQAKRGSHHQQQTTAAECSVSQDEDVDDEPGAGGRRSSSARGTKRSRTAEVHNLSERRRRDRINEKMRALQELIPNCNKIDKASMLEEAIEYLKTLQLQVQMMSMGAAPGLCVPPHHMLMQMQMPHMSPFPHLGMGLGFGMGAFGMGTHQFPCPPAMAMPHGSAMFGMHGQVVMPPPFHHMNGGVPAEQMREVAAADPGPAPGGDQVAGDHPPQGDQKL